MVRITIVMLALVLSLGCSQTLPLNSLVNEDYVAHPGKYEIVGEVEGRSTAAVLLGILPLKTDAGFDAAYRDALENSGAPDATDLIEVYSDRKITYFPFIWMPIYASHTTIVHATAVKDLEHHPGSRPAQEKPSSEPERAEEGRSGR